MMISYILAVLTGILLLVGDQVTKHIVAAGMELGENGPVLIPGVIDTVYIKNDGGAWGMLGGSTWLLLSLTCVIMLVCIALLLKYGTKDKTLFWAIILVLSGGIGNMTDRVFRGGYVVDFLHFAFMPQFPVFNAADCGVCIGAALLLIYFIGGMIKESRLKKIKAEAETSGEKNEKV